MLYYCTLYCTESRIIAWLADSVISVPRDRRPRVQNCIHPNSESNAQIHQVPGIIRVGAGVTSASLKILATKHMEIQPSGSKHFLDQVLEIQAPRSNALTHQEELSCVAASTGHPEMKTEPHVIDLSITHLIPFKLPSRAIKMIHCWQIETQSKDWRTTGSKPACVCNSFDASHVSLVHSKLDIASMQTFNYTHVFEHLMATFKGSRPLGDHGTISLGQRARPFLSIPSLGHFALILTLWVPLSLSLSSPSIDSLMVSLLPLSLFPSPWPLFYMIALFQWHLSRMVECMVGAFLKRPTMQPTMRRKAWLLVLDVGIWGPGEPPMLNRMPTYLAFGSSLLSLYIPLAVAHHPMALGGGSCISWRGYLFGLLVGISPSMSLALLTFAPIFPLPPPPPLRWDDSHWPHFYP